MAPPYCGESQLTVQEHIEAFLDGTPHAVVGASTDRSKYGNKALRAYLQNDRMVLPVNPKADKVEGLKSYPDLSSLPATVHGISVSTPPKVTESIVEEAARLGIRHVWLQPGAESEQAISRGQELGLNLIAGGPCVLVVLRYKETRTE
jgi:predicted CoA-binding protein